MGLIKCKDCKKEVSTSSKKCPNCGAPIKKPVSGAAVIVLVLLLSTFIHSLFTTKPTTKDKDSSEKQPSQNELHGEAVRRPQKIIDSGLVAGYEIIEKEDVSIKAVTGRLSSQSTTQLRNLPMNKRVRVKAVVDKNITREQVRPTVEKIIKDITLRDADIDEISLLIYSDKELIDDVYDIAISTWAPKGEWGNVTPKIAKDNIRSDYRTDIDIREGFEKVIAQRSKDEKRFGFTEQERRQIYKELVKAETKANEEANRLFPKNSVQNASKNADKYFELIEEYKKQVMKKWGITEEQESKITVEAWTENWPTD